jgi:hypothetical protein
VSVGSRTRSCVIVVSCAGFRSGGPAHMAPPTRRSGASLATAAEAHSLAATRTVNDVSSCASVTDGEPCPYRNSRSGSGSRDNGGARSVVGLSTWRERVSPPWSRRAVPGCR